MVACELILPEFLSVLLSALLPNVKISLPRQNFKIQDDASRKDKTKEECYLYEILGLSPVHAFYGFLRSFYTNINIFLTCQPSARC